MTNMTEGCVHCMQIEEQHHGIACSSLIIFKGPAANPCLVLEGGVLPV